SRPRHRCCPAAPGTRSRPARTGTTPAVRWSPPVRTPSGLRRAGPARRRRPGPRSPAPHSPDRGRTAHRPPRLRPPEHRWVGGVPPVTTPSSKPALSAYGDPVIPDPSALTPPVRRKPLLAVLLAPLFMALIAVSVINVGLTAIGEGL